MLMNFASTWNKLLKRCISTQFLLVGRYVKVGLRKKLHIAPFVELLWEGPTDEFCQYLEQST